MSSNNTGAFFTGFLLGGLAGAAAALLLTPQSGETTRLQIRERGIELKTQFDDLSGVVQERGKDLVEERLPKTARTGTEEMTEAADAQSDEATAIEDDA
jgi:gas vesicle protein